MDFSDGEEGGEYSDYSGEEGYYSEGEYGSEEYESSDGEYGYGYTFDEEEQHDASYHLLNEPEQTDHKWTEEELAAYYEQEYQRYL